VTATVTVIVTEHRGLRDGYSDNDCKRAQRGLRDGYSDSDCKRAQRSKGRLQ